MPRKPKDQESQRIFISLATMGLQNNAAIVRLAARVSDDDVYIVNVSLTDQLDNYAPHFSVDGGTILWWVQQEERIRTCWTTSPQQDPHEVCSQLQKFIIDHGGKEAEVWFLSARFHCPILENLFHQTQGDNFVPWNLKKTRCLSTLGSIFPNVQRQAPTYDPLADSRTDLVWLNRLLEEKNKSIVQQSPTSKILLNDDFSLSDNTFMEV